MIPKPVETIEAADILALIDNQDEENRKLDFKRDLPGNTDENKRELRADVTSFANSAGGDLIFGVDEVDGVATDVPGLPGINADAEICRIEQIIQSNIEPRVPGFESRAIDIPDKGPVIVVRVPKSWRGPHMVKINDAYRMYGRNSKGKYIFDATEFRSAFALSEQLSERIRRWRDDRLANVIGGETPVPLMDGARLIIHLVPLSSFADNVEMSAGDLVKHYLAFCPPGSRSFSHRVNIDGVITFSGPRGETTLKSAYCQLFRGGRVEAVSTEIVNVHNDRRSVASVWYEQIMMESIDSYLGGLNKLTVPTPILILVAISGAKGAWFAVNQRLMGMGDSMIDRDMLILPDVLVESFGTEIQKLLRPIFDAVWNSAGWEQSLNYDEQGIWKPRD